MSDDGWSYNPAVVGNIVAATLLVISGLTYWITRQTAAARKAELLPDVSSKASALHSHDGWFAITLTITNKATSPLHLTSVQLNNPGYVVGISDDNAFASDGAGGSAMKATLPKEIATRSINMGNAAIAPGATAKKAFYVCAKGSEEMFFEVKLSSRPTDIRRSDLHVSNQKITLPTKQAV